MIKRFLKNNTGIDADSPEYRGCAGWIKLISSLAFAAAAFFYLIAAGMFLPLYLPGYKTLGTDKSLFWIGSLKITLWIFLAAFSLHVISRIVWLLTEDAPLLRFSIPELKKHIGIHEVFTVLFAVCVIISYVLSSRKDIALFGESNWYVGAWEYLALCICMLVIGRTALSGRIFTGVILVSSIAVYAAGIIIDLARNRLDIDGLDGSKVSTIGNPNWFCGYMVCVLFLPAAVYMIREKKTEKDTRVISILCMICFLAGAYSFFAQGSLSAFPAAYAVLLVLLVFSEHDLYRLKKISELTTLFITAGLMHAMAVMLGIREGSGDALTRFVCGVPFLLFLFAVSAIIMFVIRKKVQDGNTSTRFHIGRITLMVSCIAVLLYALTVTINTVSGGVLGTGPVLYFGDEWASYRGITTSTGLTLFGGMTVREKFFGTGPDTFYSLIYSGRYPLLAAKVTESFGGARLTNAHSEPVTMLVNTGLLGTAAFYGILISLFMTLFRAARKTDRDNADARSYRTAALIAALGIAAYAVNNLFSFQTAMNLSQLSLLAGFGASAVRMLSGTEDK